MSCKVNKYLIKQSPSGAKILIEAPRSISARKPSEELRPWMVEINVEYRHPHHL